MTIPIPDIQPARRLRLCALASGSRAIAYIGYGSTHILIDCGIAQRDIAAGLKARSENSRRSTRGNQRDAISHRHFDHNKSCARLPADTICRYTPARRR